MYVQERGAYYEAHRGAPGYVFWALWLVWVLVNIVAFLVSESLGQSVQAILFPPEPLSPRLLSLEGLVISDGVLQYGSAVIGGLVAGVTLGVIQGVVLLPFLKMGGLLEWVLATTMGRAVRWIAMYVISRELIGLTLDRHIVGVLVLFTLFIAVGSIAGVALGYAQSIVLRHRVHHSEWWTLANIPGPVVAGLIISMTLYIEGENTLRDATTPMIAVVTGAVTGIALIDLLRHPSQQAEWLEQLRWRPQRPQPPPEETVLGSTLYTSKRTEPTFTQTTGEQPKVPDTE